MIRKSYLLICALFVLVGLDAGAQNIGIKSNLPYWALGGTMNASVEWALTRRLTLDVGGGYNPWRPGETRRLKHWLVQPELRIWRCESFNGHFVGLHATVAEYNLSEMPFGIGHLKSLRHNRYQGHAYGGGVSYGYQWWLGRSWNLEMSLGGGYMRLKHDKYPCGKCAKSLGSEQRDYFGITRATVSIIYFIN